MAFSESFGLGDSTFMNLETKANEALRGNRDDNPLNIYGAPKSTSNTSPIDVIDESPTNLKQKTNKSRTRNNASQFGEKRRRQFQKSKSESILEGKSRIRSRAINSAHPSKDDGYSEFFKSDFSIEQKEDSKEKLKSLIGASEVQAVAQCINSDRSKDDFETPQACFVDSKVFSEMLGAMKSQDDKVPQVLEIPIFSEDLQKILNDSSMVGSQDPNIQIESDNSWGESLDLSECKEKPAFGVANANGNIEERGPPEEVVQIDDATFICMIENNQCSFREEVNNATSEVKSLLQVEQENNLIAINKSRNISLRNQEYSKANSKPKNTSISNPIVSYEVKHDLEELKKLSAWNLPASVLKEYDKKRICKMFDWQVECLSNTKVLFEHCNLVYSAPTSAGKTLVSEILLIKTILERGKKVILILPFISVVREKMISLQDLLTISGYRVEGFFGGYTPPGGFDNINVAICTIEKANSIVNKLLEQGKLEEIGTVVVDEIHLISDPGRGYILELLLAKILYMSRKYGLQIQIITMSATLANVELLKKWLDAELYITQFRPVDLHEMIKIGTKIFDKNLELVREISTLDFKEINDQDHVAQLCIETIADGCSVVVFCPSKDWCENLSIQLASAINSIGRSGSEIGNKLRANIKRDAVEEVKKQLRDIPTGLDSVLEKTINYAVAFHHAGLTMEERDIIETCFKSGSLKIIVATSTLSSGVNLPARRVIIRSPLFGGKQMSSLTYKQMIGRAGRTGKDTLGESILICSDSNARVGRDLVSAELNPIKSCLEMDSSTHLKRALLEVISSGVAITKGDIDNFINCTLLKTQKEIDNSGKEDEREADRDQSFVNDSLDFLIEHEFVRLQRDEEKCEDNYVATRLGMACLASSMPPTDGLILFSELQKARRCFVLESELHAVYLVTPYSVCYQLQDLDWLLYLDLWEKLSPAMKKVGELVGVKESFLVRAMRGQTKLDYKLLQIHKRFYTALALQELVNETSINVVAAKYKCTRGLLQSLQQVASTFAGIVTAFCNSLKWSTLSLIVGQFKERLFFGVHRDLIDLMRLPILNYKRARILFDAGIENLIDLANADVFTIEKILHNSLSFDTAKKLENEDEYEKDQRNVMRNIFITGKAGLTVQEAAKMLVTDARQFVRFEIGGGNIDWSHSGESKNVESTEESNIQTPPSEGNVSKRKAAIEHIDVSPPKVKRQEVLVNGSHPNVYHLPEKTKNERNLSDSKCSIEVRNTKMSTKVDKPTDSNSNDYSSPVTTNCINGKEQVRQVKMIRNDYQTNIGRHNDNIKPKQARVQQDSKPQPSSIQPKRSMKSASKLSPINRSAKKENHDARRSPRNHVSSSTKCENVSSPRNDLFMNETSFEINSAIVNGMDEKNLHRKSPLINKSSDEIAASQEMTFQPKTQSTRLLRSCKERTRNHSPLKQHANIIPDESNTIELSDDSLGNSLVQNPIQLNSSHIMSISKTEPDALSLDCINIIDICGSQILFKNAMKEILTSRALGFSIGLEKQANQLKPLIGANLLINQVASKENCDRKAVDFYVDDSSYISGVAMVISENVSFFMNLQAEDTCAGITKEMKIEYLFRLLNSSDITLQIYDSKEQLKMLKKAIPGIKAIHCKLEDPKVANWLLQPDKTMSFVSMARQFAPECKALVELSGSGRGISSIGLDSSCAIFGRIRSSIEACVTIHILKGQVENLKRIGTGQLYKFFIDLEMPLQLSLYNMETCGFPANDIALRERFQLIMDTMKKLEAKIYETHGSRFNLGSSSAVAKVLGLHRKTNGRVSTSKQILEKVDSPIAQMIISYRKLSVTLTKTIQPLLRSVVENRIRGNSITFTSTGRISMQEPNLQNVAKDFDVMIASEKIEISCRSSFFPPEGRCLISADFCQLEMRILAHLSQDSSLVKAMNSEKDVFIAIASKWNRVPENSVSEQLRNGTKQICYAIVYGMGMRSLAESLKCTEQEATSVSEQFHAAYPGIRLYAEKVVRFARQHGYIETITGRRRYLDHINSDEMHLKSQAERQAVNSAIQGSAADIAKSAILRMEKNLNKYREKIGLAANAANLVLHLHDELIFEVPEDKAKKVAKVLNITMENCVKLSVSLKVRLKVGKSWGSLQEIKL